LVLGIISRRKHLHKTRPARDSGRSGIIASGHVGRVGRPKRVFCPGPPRRMVSAGIDYRRHRDVLGGESPPPLYLPLENKGERPGERTRAVSRFMGSLQRAVHLPLSREYAETKSCRSVIPAKAGIQSRGCWKGVMRIVRIR
jgi:hypothetical protein